MNQYKAQSQGPDEIEKRQNNPFLQSQTNLLQDELQRTNQINQNLRLELKNQGSGITGIKELLRRSKYY